MKNRIEKIGRYAVLLLCFAVISSLIPQITVHAEQEQQEQQKVVRVGWYESSFNKTEKSGKKSGYAYEYQLKLASYANWRFQYITGSWSELFEMLK